MSGNFKCAAEDTESDLVNLTIAKWAHSGNLTSGGSQRVAPTLAAFGNDLENLTIGGGAHSGNLTSRYS